MLQPKSNERLVSEIVRKVRNKYTRTGLNQADQLDTLWNDLGRTPDWVIGCFEESIKKALAQKDAEVAEARKEEQAKNRFVIRKCKEPGGYMCMSYEPVIKPQFGSTPQEALANYLSALKE